MEKEATYMNKQRHLQKQISKQKIAIIGGGPGGLAVSLLLAHQGFDITLYEANDRVGGRSSLIEMDGYRFDAGPTFFIYRYILDKVFARIGKKLDDYVTLTPINPLYDLIFPQKTFRPSHDHHQMMKEIHRVFPGEEKGYQLYLKKELKRFKKITPILELPFHSPLQFLNPKVLSAFFQLDLGHSLYQRLKSYFHSDELVYSMAFQAKYLGMSPWQCPSLFSILSFMEHEYGIFHIQGGLFHLNETMAALATSMGVKIHLNSPVTQLTSTHGKIRKIKVNSKWISYDRVVLNADFSKALSLFQDKDLPKQYRLRNRHRLQHSCSTFNLYLGLDKLYPIAHHSIVFSQNYKAYVATLSDSLTLSKDPSFYVHNPSVIDTSLAPPNHASLYILLPVPHLKANIDWHIETPRMTEWIISQLEKKLGLKDIRNHIVKRHVISPQQWQDDYHVHLGANFNLSHSFKQLLYFRPHNKFQKFQNLYLVGGGTHPGSGLPTIYQSALIAADLIARDTTR
jgi:phytoene desaturase